MLLINLFGGPGTGKSTLASDIFSQFKKEGFNIEYLQEFAKQKLYEEANKVFSCEPYIFGKQLYRQKTISDSVECIVTDSPILLPHFYETDKEKQELLRKLELTYFKEFDNLNIFIVQQHEYQSEGRFQTEQEADEISNQILHMLQKENIPFYFRFTKDPLENIFSIIRKELLIRRGEKDE